MKKQGNRRSMHAFKPLSAVVIAITTLCAGNVAQAAITGGAQVVYLQGKGERSEPGRANAWQPLAVNEKVPAGATVRTLGDSQLAIVMPDHTQMRLQPNSQLEVGSLAEPSGAIVSILRLVTGRIWSIARPPTIPGETGQRVRLTTATATIGIRGTDWEVEVQPDGSTQLVVLSGVVDMSNEHGAVVVASGEAAVAKPGQAPQKFVLVNPQSRVQWVSAWKPQPRRWAGGDASRLSAPISRIENGEYTQAEAELQRSAASDPASAALLADLLMQRGEFAAAQNALAAHARGGAGDPRAVALLSQVMARQDQTEQAQALVASALQSHPKDPELLVAQGDLAVLQGDAVGARRAYQAVIEVQPNNVDAWYGLGLIASQREQVRLARESLGEAIKRDPADGRAQGELAATEAFAGNLDSSRKLLEQVLAREPSNYGALTALGVTKLKAGQSAEALDDFLRAGVIEPRYSRAWLYSGVAFYQMGERKRAEEAFQRAAQLDPRDPIPYMYRAMVETDGLDPGAAIGSARAAQERMPFLKSLNQVANNQRGSANLGSSLTAFGLEEWADFYATQAFSNYWGGSHLFLADRYTGKFNKNSELFKGYLTEPTSFGADPKRANLIATPGHYGKVDVMYERDDWQQVAAIGTVNGLTVSPVPFAYYVSGDFGSAESRSDSSAGRARNFTVGLGTKPTYQVGVFAFATDTELHGHLRSASLPSDFLDQREQRADIGFNYKIEPDNQMWFKVGTGSQHNSVAGGLVSAPLAAQLNTLFGTAIFSPSGSLDAFSSKIDQEDAQFRQSLNVSGVDVSWGVERSRQVQSGGLSTTFSPVQLVNTQKFTLHDTDVYVSGIMKMAGGNQAQVDLFGQRSEQHRNDVNTLTVLSTVPPSSLSLENSTNDKTYNEINPRLGFQWQLAPMRTVRAVWQQWRRPASVGTLSDVETVGIPMNDRYVSAGGKYEQGRIQYDGEMGSSAFVRAYAGHERIDNGMGGRRTAVSDFQLSQLESLKNRPDIFPAKPDLEDTPLFQEGRVETLGFAYNRLLSRTQSIAARYMWRKAEQTGANDGLQVPLVPRHFAEVASQWSIPGRWLLGVSAAYRSSRFRDDVNLDPIKAGWSFGGTAYWESQDKHSTVYFILDNLLADRAAGLHPDPHFVARYSYRF